MKKLASKRLAVYRMVRKLFPIWNKIVSAIFSSFRSVGWYLTGTTVTTVIAGRIHWKFLPFWSPTDGALGIIWQVHASFISIGFAGLAIAFQLLVDPPLAAGPARRAVINRIRFTQVVLFSIGADVIAGLAATWLESDLNVAVVFLLILLPSTAAIGYLYANTARIFSNPRQIEQWTFDDLIASAKKIAVELADIRARNMELYDKLDGLPGFLTSPKDFSGEFSCDVFPKEAGVVKSVDWSLLNEVSRLAEGSNNQFEGTPLSGISPTPEGARIRVDFIARMGVELSPSAPIAHIMSLTSLDKWTLKAFREVIDGCLTVRPQKDSYGGQHLQREMEDLQDNLILAIRDGKYSTAKRGYEYYRGIASATRQQIQNETASDEQITNYGEWQWLDRQAWEVNDAAVTAGPRFSIMAIGAALMRCSDSAGDGDLSAFRSSLASYEQIWHASLEKDGGEGVVGNLLISLQNLTEYVVPSKQSSPGSLVNATLDTWIHLCKGALDADKAQIFRQTIDFHRSLFRFSDTPETLNEVRLGQLILFGWYLFSRQSKGTPKSIDLDVLLNSQYSGSIWGALGLSIERESNGRWSWWEHDWSQPAEMKFHQLSTYVDKAALILLSRYGFGENIAATSDSYSVAFRLLQQIEDLAENWNTSYGDKDRLNEVRMTLEGLVKSWNENQSELLWSQPITQERIDRFIVAFDEELGKVESVSYLFQSNSGHIIPEGKTSILGGRFLVNKEYFVESGPHVYANPDMLAQQFARSMASGEDKMVVDHLANFGLVEDVEFDAAIDRITDWINSTTDPVVFIMGSHMIASQLGYFNQEDSSSSPENNVILKMVYSGEDQFNVMLADRSSAPRIRRWPEEKDGMQPVGSHYVSAGISVVPRDDDKYKLPVALLEIGSSYYWEDEGDVAIVLLNVSGAEY
jgi:hypothetical protein